MTNSLILPVPTSTPSDTITLFEYETTDQLSDLDLIHLSRLSRRTGIEILKPSLRNGKTYFQARQYVGTVRLGNRTIQILPKIYCKSSREQSEQEAAQNLLLMLDYAGYLGIREVGLAALQRSQNWFEVLVYLFATHLKRQWQRGASRRYQSMDANLPVLKGKWQIAAQIRRPEQKHRFSVTYDEFTSDTQLNRLLRYVVESLWRLTQDSLNRKHLSDLRFSMDEVTLLPTMSVQDAAQIQLTRLDEHYRPLLNLARLFLENLGLQVSANDLTSFAFVFDMNQLFERFLIAFISRHRKEILPDSLQSCELLPQGRQAAKYLASYRGKPVFHLRPDLVFRQDGQFPLLIDFKYRRPPFLFEKTEQSEWFLTNDGKEYVEANLSDVVDKIRKPDAYEQRISDYFKTVTFHQSFAYEEFVEGLKPVLVEGQISYEVVDGIFKDICRRAQNDSEHKYLLIIDEINRANVAKVFGELITLIEDDKRLEGDNEVTVQLPYSKETFGVPENLLILGTMNTADRSIALLDTALRRRFAFVEKMPDSSLLDTVEDIDLAALLDRINLRVSALMGQDYQLGHSYFMNINDVAELHLVWYQQIIPLLKEYFFNDFERLKAVLDKQFVESIDSNAKLIGDLQHLYNLESQYVIKVFSPDATFINALKAIYA